MKLGLIGYPLGHSWSPNIHAFFLKEDCYRLYELKEEDLPSFFASTDLDGFNVTIPYKQTVMQYLDEIDPLVREKLNFLPVSTVDEVIPAALSENLQIHEMPPRIPHHRLQREQTGFDRVKA